MKSPNELAFDIRRSYFKQNQQEVPEDIARQIFNVVRVDDRTHKWTSENLANRAYQVIKEAVFDIDDLAENHLGLNISIQHLGYMDCINNTSVYGVSYPDSGEFIVCERAAKYEPLYRSTVAHEAGHCCLHKSHAYRSLMFTPNISNPGVEETEANEFMVSLLLPSPLLWLSIVYCCHFWRQDIKMVVGCANSERGRWVWKKRIFPFLINNFCVSRQMLSIRMKKAGVFNEDTLNYHKTYRLETKWDPPKKVHLDSIGRTLHSLLINNPNLVGK